MEIGRRLLDHTARAVLRDEMLGRPAAGSATSGGPRVGGGDPVLRRLRNRWARGPDAGGSPGAKRDFVDFVRNIGQPPDKDFGGGSFGYGKAAFYIASAARTILIDTLCRDADGELERRFIGARLVTTSTMSGRPYTGRHWWGRVG